MANNKEKTKFDYNGWIDLIPGFCFQAIMRPFNFFFLKLLFNLEIKGLKNLIPFFSGQGVIIAANHTHELDGFFLPASIPLNQFPKPFHPVTREGEFYADKGLRGKIYAHGLLFYIMGAFPARAGLGDYKKSLKNQIRLLKDEEPVLIFPEGKARNRRMEARPGVGYLSIYTQTPVVPVYFQGPKKSTFLNKNNPSRVIIGTPIDPPSRDSSNKGEIELSREFSKKIMNVIYELKE